jgi:ferredoxin, 2Fe-2S
MKVIVTGIDGTVKEIEGKAGWTLMEIIRDAGMPIKAECGGACACATCHVYIDDEWLDATGARSEEEEDMIDLALEVEDNSRLACQIEMSESLDGIRVKLARDAVL